MMDPGSYFFAVGVVVIITVSALIVFGDVYFRFIEWLHSRERS